MYINSLNRPYENGMNACLAVVWMQEWGCGWIHGMWSSFLLKWEWRFSVAMDLHEWGSLSYFIPLLCSMTCLQTWAVWSINQSWFSLFCPHSLSKQSMHFRRWVPLWKMWMLCEGRLATCWHDTLRLVVHSIIGEIITRLPSRTDVFMLSKNCPHSQFIGDYTTAI